MISSVTGANGPSRKRFMSVMGDFPSMSLEGIYPYLRAGKDPDPG